MFTYYTIIGRDLNLLHGHVSNIKGYAGFDKIPGDKEFLAIVYVNPTINRSTTDEILRYCSESGVRTVVYEEPKTTFLNNLYACWNLGYEASKPGFVFRGGSDQVFSKDGVYNMYMSASECAQLGERVVLQANTIESPRAGLSRHFIRDFGLTFETFKLAEFEMFCEELMSKTDKRLLNIEESLAAYGHPTSFNSSLGHTSRTDGCSWLFNRDDWVIGGKMPPIERGITGDVLIHDRLQVAGYKNYLVSNCITYHFVRGESKDLQG